MLKHLSVINYALIEKLDMDFHKGFSVITGETGAGKSIILGALALVLGKRSDIKVLLDKEKKCIVEATFDIEALKLESFFSENDLDYEHICIIRREIWPSGKSRAFVNDSPVLLPLMKKLGEKLVDIHSQHETLNLHSGYFQLKVLDSFAEIRDSVDEYNKFYNKHQKLQREYDALVEKESKARQEQDFLQYQYDELSSAELKRDEQNPLEAELKVLNNINLIKSNLFDLTQVFASEEGGITNSLTEAGNLIKGIVNLDDAYQELEKRVESVSIELSDISYEIESLMEKLEPNPERQEEINDRLDVIYRLQHKHRMDSVEALLELQEEIELQLVDYSSLEEEIERYKEILEKSKEELYKKAMFLSERRRTCIPEFEESIISIIHELGMENARFEAAIETVEEPIPNGIDKLRFLFNANKGTDLSELSKAASGGELSRVMLAIKSLVAESSMMPTIIFDEIDTGVSGEVAGKVGKILRKMSKDHQLMAITHLPQIAGKGLQHYLVYKKTDDNSTKSSLRLLGQEERVTELAKMLSSERITEAAISTAKELLDIEI
ncbi:MAG: DNA repair protein RecN [Hyphomicrobiales bacterium]